MAMQRSSLIKLSKNLLLALLALLLSGVAYQVRTVKTDSDDHAHRFQIAFLESEQMVNKELMKFVEQYAESSGQSINDPHYLEKLHKKFYDKGIAFFVIQNNQLTFWSHNAIPLHNIDFHVNTSGALQKDNGWYYYQTHEVDNQVYVVFYAVKTNYKYQNEFLENKFQENLPGLESLFFVSDRPDAGYMIMDSEGNFLFSLAVHREQALIMTVGVIYFLSLIAAIAAWLILIYTTFRYFSRLFQAGKQGTAIAGFLISLFAMRFLSVWLKIPGVFYDGYMFSPELYAASVFLPSLGDLLLHLLLITAFGYFLFHNLRNIPITPPRNKVSAVLMGFGLITLIYLICALAIYLIQGLVINSHLNLDVNFILKLDVYSLIGFLIIGLIFFSFYFFSIVLCRLTHSLVQTHRHFVLTFIAALVLLIVLTLVLYGMKPLLWMLIISSVFVFELDRRRNPEKIGLSTLVIALFVFSVISTFALYQFNEVKELNKRNTLALQLASEQDPVAEFLFREFENDLFNDNQLQNLIKRDPYNEAAIYNYLQYHYFYDFWAKYDMQITVCQPEEPLLIKPANIELPCAAFFDDYIGVFGKQTISDHLIYLDNNTGRNSYITHLSTEHSTEGDYPVYHLYIEFDAKVLVRDMGFPELLIDDAVDINRELLNYSYATYKNGILVNEIGSFVYNIHVDVYEVPDQEFTRFSFGGYHHLAYQKDEDTLIMVSRPQISVLEAVAPFSYLFITFIILVMVFWLLVNRTRPRDLLKMNFRKRVQFSMIAILLLSALTFGGASVFFIFNIYENKNTTFLNEKTHSVLAEIESTLADEYYLDYTMQHYLYDILLKYSNVFFTDVNIYSTHGFLIASSRPRVFEEGLVGSNMHPIAFHNIHKEQKSHFIHTEQIGNLQYLSSYTPLLNRYDEKIGYLNLPYFARESALRNELSYFLVAFVNIYVLLVVLAVVLALFISNYVTKPLQLIREKLARIQLGKTNEKIVWTRQDEIGNLINEYNRMIDELSVSADLLARSERETAWREMARQVAHEIKNPLTPMKLSVQYLEKAWKDKVPDWNNRLERFSRTMVEQIDNLSVIAREFSDFAQMPAGENDKINLRTFIPEVLDLYKGHEKLNIRLLFSGENQELVVHADRKQMLRVFNNLIKNAIQAYEKDETAEIEVACFREQNQCIIKISDSGFGIPESQKDNIFTPYYTTKAKGMGLGLSMVKNIIAGIGGRIDFYSKEGEGSTFILILPVAPEEN